MLSPMAKECRISNSFATTKGAQTETSPFSSVYTQTEFHLQSDFAASSLLMLLRRCLHPTCFLPAKIKNFSLKGCQLIVSLQCSDDHTSFWKSQPDCNRFLFGNLMNAAAVLFSANTYQRIASFFQLANVWQVGNGFRKQVTTKLKKKFSSIVNQNYVQHSKEI